MVSCYTALTPNHNLGGPGPAVKAVLGAKGVEELVCRRQVQAAYKCGGFGAGIKAENMLLDKREPPNVKISSVGYYKATLDTVPKSRVGSFGFVGMAPAFRRHPPSVPSTQSHDIVFQCGLSFNVACLRKDLADNPLPLQRLRSF